MQLIAPDILREAHGLPFWICATGAALGLLLWLTGWWGHRFWIVLASTVTAGILGLISSPVSGMKPLVAGLLLAIAAGVLALALVRFVIFAAGGSAASLAMHALMPAAWDEPLGWFLLGGLVSLLLFRVWTMALTSGVGSLVASYSLLGALDSLGRIDAVAYAETHTRFLNGLGCGVALLGVVLQIAIERRRMRREEEKDAERRHIEERVQEKLKKRRGWFSWRNPGYRQAG